MICHEVDSKLDEVLDAVTTMVILAAHRKVDSKLDEYPDSITAHFCTDWREINTTIDDKIHKERAQITEDITRKINESLLNEWLVMQKTLLAVCQRFSNDLANTAKLLNITVETMVANSGKLSNLETTVNTLALDLAAVRDFQKQVGNIADMVARADGDLSALRNLQATTLETAVTAVKSQVGNFADTVVRLDGNIATIHNLVTNARSLPVNDNKLHSPPPHPSSTGNPRAAVGLCRTSGVRNWESDDHHLHRRPPLPIMDSNLHCLTHHLNHW